ncbi:energy transducer TonB [Synechococcus sp. H55.10]|uniref:energy transducer TonB n=1 Tax=Synechococcus sp. H55.10 TaxID=2964503 RepID=UPI0039C74B3C
MLAKPPTPTDRGSASLQRGSYPRLLWRLQMGYWQQAGMAYGVGLAWLELGLWGVARGQSSEGLRWIGWGEKLLRAALLAGYCSLALSVACTSLEDLPELPGQSRELRPLRWETLLSLLLHLLGLLGWGSRPLREPEVRIPVTLWLEDPPPAPLEAAAESALPDPAEEPTQLASESPPAAAPLPPDPAPQQIQASSLTTLPTPPPTPVPTAKLGPTPTPTPMAAPTPPPPSPTPTVTPSPQQPPPTPVATPTAAPVANRPPSGAATSAPIPRFTSLIQGIRSGGGGTAGSKGSESSAPGRGVVAGLGGSRAQGSAPTAGEGAGEASTPTSSPAAVAANPDILARPIPGRNPPPQYPPQARRLGQQGQVLLRARVDAQGQVQQVEIVSSSGFPALDRAAQEAVQGWQFSPALRNNTPIESWVTVPIQFTLN